MPLKEKAINCRLCEGNSKFQFTKKLLNKYWVDYFKCTKCGSLQTENPFWLPEAYEKGNLVEIDTGAFQRNLQNLAASFLIAKLIGAKSIFDFGGGDGLLCRMLRDYGLNVFVSDKFAQNTYAKGFDANETQKPNLILAFEVFEHFADPYFDLNEIFELNPKAVLATTGIYKNQPSDWWYLTPATGQHVFFYSETSLRNLASTYGYRLIRTGKFLPMSGYLLFTKSRNPFSHLFSYLFLNPVFCWVIRSILVLFPGFGALKDHRLLTKKNTQT